MAETPDFKQLVPGFDFLQGLAKNATASLPAIGQWMTPTLDPAELERRIGELRTVQFWLEQNATLLGTTIQALEVQRMTLSTLKTMNVQMEDLRESLKIRMPGDAHASSPSPSPSAAAGMAGAGGSSPEAAKAQDEARPAIDTDGPADTGKPGAAAAPAPAAGGLVDPMQWWGALTQQFSQLAAAALKDAPEAARDVAASMVQPAKTAANDAPARPALAAKSAPKAKGSAPVGKAASSAAATKTPATRKSPAARKRPPR